MKRAAAGAILLAGAALGGCPSDIRRADTGGLVATYRAPAASLAGRTAFLLPAVAGRAAAEGEATVAAAGLLADAAAELTARGFHKAADVDPRSPPASPPDADLALVLTDLEASRPEPAFWTAYPGYLQPPAYGHPGLTWSYGWGWLSMTVPPGTWLLEVADLRGCQGGACPVLWSALLVPATGADPSPDGPDLRAAAAQAFAQSPWLRPGGTP